MKLLIRIVLALFVSELLLIPLSYAPPIPPVDYSTADMLQAVQSKMKQDPKFKKQYHLIKLLDAFGEDHFAAPVSSLDWVVIHFNELDLFTSWRLLERTGASSSQLEKVKKISESQLKTVEEALPYLDKDDVGYAWALFQLQKLEEAKNRFRLLFDVEFQRIMAVKNPSYCYEGGTGDLDLVFRFLETLEDKKQVADLRHRLEKAVAHQAGILAGKFCEKGLQPKEVPWKPDIIIEMKKDKKAFHWVNKIMEELFVRIADPDLNEADFMDTYDRLDGSSSQKMIFCFQRPDVLTKRQLDDMILKLKALSVKHPDFQIKVGQGIACPKE